MGEIRIAGTGLVYRNPKPHVRSVHAYFPSVVRAANGELVCSVVLGEAFEAPDLRTCICRSLDDGETWAEEGRIYSGTGDRSTSDACRLTALPDGGLVAFMVRCDRGSHPGEGLGNPETLGFVPTELLLLRSPDAGRSWSAPERVRPPLEGPEFELCSPITILRDGRWIWPTSTWPDWEGNCPNGIRMVALVSYDRGLTWPEYRTVMERPGGRVFFWESKIVELMDGRLLAVAWAYDDEASADLPNAFALSADGGATWAAPRSTGLVGQTLTPHVLTDGRILSVYRRMDKPGLWANLYALEADEWVNQAAIPLWGADTRGLTGETENAVHNFNVLRFGAPALAELKDGAIFTAFWCYEDCVSVIRWFKLEIP